MNRYDNRGRYSCKIIHAHSYSACWVTTISVCVCGWLFLKRERESFLFYFSVSRSLSLFAAIWTSMQKHCCCALRPTGVAMVTAVITEPCVTNRCKHWKMSSFFLFWESCWIFNFTAFSFFLLAVLVMLHKNPDLLLTQGFFYVNEGMETKS